MADKRVNGAPSTIRCRSSCFTSFAGRDIAQSVADVITKDADMMVMLDVLARDVGVIGVFSDWPATTTYYANCILDYER